jgi:hypothetical protein
MLKIPVSCSDDFAVNYDTVDCENLHMAVEIWLTIQDMADFDLRGCSSGFDTCIKNRRAPFLEDGHPWIGHLIASSNFHSFSVLERGHYINDLGLNVRAYLKGIQETCS